MHCIRREVFAFLYLGRVHQAEVRAINAGLHCAVKHLATGIKIDVRRLNAPYVSTFP